MLERIISNENLNEAFKRVKKNKGSHGIDKMGVDELLPYLKKCDEYRIKGNETQTTNSWMGKLLYLQI